MAHEFYTQAELLAKKSGQFVFDVESYNTYFLAAFMDYDNGKIAYFEATDGEPLPTEWLQWMLTNFCVIGFNSKSYDMPICGLALTGATPETIKDCTNDIIIGGLRTADIELKYGFKTPQVNHVDLIEVAPLQGSLKLYAGRLHTPHMQDLPFHPDMTLTREQIAITRNYCFNDLANTRLLCRELSPHLELRASLGYKYQRDLRSKSDAQLAQEIINIEINKVTGKYPKRPGFEKLVGTSFQYDPPSYIGFALPQLSTALAEIRDAQITVGTSGHVICPKEIEGRKLTIADKVYTIGIGGLHSIEKAQAVTNATDRILDRDVTGYYPNLILKNNFAPPHLGDAFLTAYQGIVDRRTHAKKIGDKTEADGLKIASNGSFGKTSDPYSTLYSPKMMIQTTLTGQLSLLMFVERLALAGFVVISANTDGVVTLCPPDRYDEFCAIVKQWERDTSLETEETEYKALYSRDVNNYIAFKLDGKAKIKGVYSDVGSALNSPLSKNPQHLVCVDAAVAHIAKGVPVLDTIQACQDIRRFVIVRSVAGGAQKDGRYLGKVIRWYYARGVHGNINYCANGNKVSLSEGGKPLMTLPNAFPTDIDYARYAELSTEILEDIGFQPKKNAQLRFL